MTGGAGFAIGYLEEREEKRLNRSRGRPEPTRCVPNATPSALLQIGVSPQEIGIAPEEIEVSHGEIGICLEEIAVCLEEIRIGLQEIGLCAEEIGLCPEASARTAALTGRRPA